MFGNSANQMEHLVARHQWGKLNKKVAGADAEAKAALAVACGKSSDEEASNMLITLLSDTDEKVLTETVKSLGLVGSENAKTHLQWLVEHLPEDKKDLKDAIRNSISEINKRAK